MIRESGLQMLLVKETTDALRAVGGITWYSPRLLVDHCKDSTFDTRCIARLRAVAQLAPVSRQALRGNAHAPPDADWRSTRMPALQASSEHPATNRSEQQRA